MKDTELKYLAHALIRPLESGGSAQSACRKHWIVIPVCDELEELPAALASLATALPQDDGQCPNVLLHVNNAPDASSNRRQANRQLLHWLRNGWTGGIPQSRLFWIDSASEGLEITRGVGEARKIGLDTALAHTPRLSSQEGNERQSPRLLVSLDADTHVAPGYWTGITNAFAMHPKAGAISIGFRHRQGRTEEEERNIRLYENYMESYVSGLKSAGSPYAYHSMGSAMASTAECYVAAGGMRMPKAGEDFYFLEAIAKVRPVLQMKEILVHPSPRMSNRVFFGTGPSMIMLHEGGSLSFFSQERFALLRQLLDAATREALESPEAFLEPLPNYTRTFLENYGFRKAWSKILANLPQRPNAHKHAFNLWFDALKTYRFIRG